MTRIGIAGIAGRMGRLLAEEVEIAGATLIGGIDRQPAPAALGSPLFPDMARLAAACDVVLDFTHASAARPHAEALGEAGRAAWVLGTSGLSAEDEAEVANAARRIPVV